jgi:APA family basic amino acid/polyamine antiporter
LRDLFIRKSVHAVIEESTEKHQGFRRSLGALNLTTIGIGAIIGAGLFVLTGTVASEHTGPAVVFSFMIAGIISLFAALCYAEFAALVPIAGSAYSYAYLTIGELPAWILGWGMTMQYLITASTVSVGWSSYFTNFLGDFGLKIPSFLASAPFVYHEGSGWEQSGSWINLPAMCVIGLMGLLISRGIKAAAGFNSVMVILKLAVVVLFIGCGIAYIQMDHFVPFIPPNTGEFGSFGWSGIFRGAGILFFAFIGFDALSTLRFEAKNPQKDMPIGMLGSISICTMIYVIFSLVLVGLVSYKMLNVGDPIAIAIDALGSGFLWLRFFVKGVIVIGLTSVIMVMLLGQTRIFYTMAHDGLLPKKLGEIHDKNQIPFFTTVLVTIVGMIIAGLFPIGILGQLASMATLLSFAIVCLAVLILHYKEPNLRRPFKTPLMPWIPILGAGSCFLQMLLLPGVTWIQLISWLVIGGIIYFSYGIKHSKLRPLRYGD